MTRRLDKNAMLNIFKYRRMFLVVLSTLLSVEATPAQRPPATGRPSDPGLDRIEVRFAVGEKAVTCDYFELSAKANRHTIVSGRFRTGFHIPSKVRRLPNQVTIELNVSCGRNSWHFSKVSKRVFLRGWWWIGTDYPPYHNEFQGPQFQDTVWVKFFITYPIDDSGFVMYKACPAKLKDQVPGPCVDD